MRKLLRIWILAFGLLGLAHESSAQFCPGVSPWVFDDVPAGDPFCGFVTKLAQQGVTLGCSVIDANHRLYCPSAVVTRLQMAGYMGRLGDVLFAQGGNAFGAPAILGTMDAQPVVIQVNAVRALRLEFNGTAANVIAGSPDNAVAAGLTGVTIAGGGGLSANAHNASGDYSSIGGGYGNHTGGLGAAVGGGVANTASAVTAVVSGGQQNVASALASAVAGGIANVASGYASAIGGGQASAASGALATVGGGSYHQVSGNHSAVLGGFSHVASGDFSAVLGGYTNKATGHYAVVLGGVQNNANAPGSFVMGYNGITTSNASGSFVYSDSSAGQFGSGQPNEFLVGATGGIGLYTSKVYASGCKIAAGGGQWTCFSSKDGKSDLAAVDPADVLERVAALPISTWRYRGEDRRIRHLGPMAQDFHAAFGLGDEETSIGVLDGSGVALAAIQGLHAQLRERDGAIAALRAQVDALAAAVRPLESRRP
jgi:hypothetical protein